MITHYWDPRDTSVNATTLTDVVGGVHAPFGAAGAAPTRDVPNGLITGTAVQYAETAAPFVFPPVGSIIAVVRCGTAQSYAFSGDAWAALTPADSGGQVLIGMGDTDYFSIEVLESGIDDTTLHTVALGWDQDFRLGPIYQVFVNGAVGGVVRNRIAPDRPSPTIPLTFKSGFGHVFGATGLGAVMMTENLLSPSEVRRVHRKLAKQYTALP